MWCWLIDLVILLINGRVFEWCVFGNFNGVEVVCYVYEMNVGVVVLCYYEMFEFNMVLLDVFE